MDYLEMFLLLYYVISWDYLIVHSTVKTILYFSVCFIYFLICFAFLSSCTPTGYTWESKCHGNYYGFIINLMSFSLQSFLFIFFYFVQSFFMKQRQEENYEKWAKEWSVVIKSLCSEERLSNCECLRMVYEYKLILNKLYLHSVSSTQII